MEKPCTSKRYSEVEDTLRNWLFDAQRVVIVGIGNPLRRDDFVGMKIVENLRNKVSRSVYLVECESVPESFIGPIVNFKPTHVLVIDAALLGLEPGAFRLVDLSRMTETPAISTHTLPIRIFCEFIKQTSGAKVALLAVQPKDASFGEGLTIEVKEAAERLTNILLRVLP